MKQNKKTDFLFYLLSNLISSLCVLVTCIIHNKLLGVHLFDVESLKCVAMCSGIHLMFTGFLAFQIVIEKFFFFEAFTYVSFFVGIILICTLKNIKEDVIPAVFGFIFLSMGIYFRFCLWRYDVIKDDKKGSL